MPAAIINNGRFAQKREMFPEKSNRGEGRMNS